jgi:hypothetical protein
VLPVNGSGDREASVAIARYLAIQSKLIIYRKFRKNIA